ncbi:MAG: IS30 family transposase [Cellvibrionaceae bacterium]|jgi:IS30 family transposase
MVGKLPNKTTAELNKKTISLINRDPLNVKTITADNGTEFHQYKVIEKKCKPSSILQIYSIDGKEVAMKTSMD